MTARNLAARSSRSAFVRTHSNASAPDWIMEAFFHQEVRQCNASPFDLLLANHVPPLLLKEASGKIARVGVKACHLAVSSDCLDPGIERSTDAPSLVAGRNESKIYVAIIVQGHEANGLACQTRYHSSLSGQA
nr:hypothetical protein [Thioclava sp. ES.031]